MYRKMDSLVKVFLQAMTLTFVLVYYFDRKPVFPLPIRKYLRLWSLSLAYFLIASFLTAKALPTGLVVERVEVSEIIFEVFGGVGLYAKAVIIHAFLLVMKIRWPSIGLRGFYHPDGFVIAAMSIGFFDALNDILIFPY